MTNDECTRANITQWLAENRQYFSDDEEFLPTSRAKHMKMRDCLHQWFGYDEGMCFYEEYWWYLYNSTRPAGGGLRQFDTTEPAFCQVPISPENQFRVRKYDLYLCQDGRLRYIPNEQTEREIEELCSKRLDKLESLGYEYDPGLDCWVNRYTCGMISG